MPRRPEEVDAHRMQESLNRGVGAIHTAAHRAEPLSLKKVIGQFMQRYQEGDYKGALGTLGDNMQQFAAEKGIDAPLRAAFGGIATVLKGAQDLAVNSLEKLGEPNPRGDSKTMFAVKAFCRGLADFIKNPTIEKVKEALVASCVALSSFMKNRETGMGR